MGNPRQHKVLIKMWLDLGELIKLERALNGEESNNNIAASDILEIIQDVFNRGDLIK